jgi:hypothetical protein
MSMPKITSLLEQNQNQAPESKVEITSFSLSESKHGPEKERSGCFSCFKKKKT